MTVIGASGSLVDDLLIISVVATIVLGLVPSVVCWLKGKRRWAVIGFFSAWHIIAAFRLAKPDSWWAQRFYDDDQLEAARGRFAPPETSAPPTAADSITPGFWEQTRDG